MIRRGFTDTPARSRNGRAPGPNVGRPTTPRRLLTVDATAEHWALCDWFRVHGCLNPAARAAELARTGVCRFYRPQDDSVVTVRAERLEVAS